MQVINGETLDALNDSIKTLEGYYRDIRSFFEFVETRFQIPEYGCALRSIGKHDLFSNSSGFKLSDESAYPYYLWLPSWLGRFYVTASDELQAKGSSDDPVDVGPSRVMSFVWLWHGAGDAYVKDTNQPECWIGVTVPEPDSGAQTDDDVALTMFQQFRYERHPVESDQTGWIEGRFYPNSIGCNLSGKWSLRRIPLRNLTTFYEIEQQVVKPVGERHKAIMTPAVQDD